jgi:choline trimethylamine-lyase
MVIPLPVTTEPYFRPSQLGPACSTPRTARLRERRVQMGRLKLAEPPHLTRLASQARDLLVELEAVDPSIARARCLEFVVEHCELPIEPDALFLGGEDPFFFNLMLPALQADQYSRCANEVLGEPARRLRDAGVFSGPCFEGHITPGLDNILSQGVAGLRARAEEYLQRLEASGACNPQAQNFYTAALISSQALARYAERYRQEAERLAQETIDPNQAAQLLEAAQILRGVPERPAQTFRQALQSFWMAYILVTLEMGGCCPGGGLGLGRLDQFLYPYYQRDIQSGQLTRSQALELMEQFLLCFCHVDDYTWHQLYTPGSQTSLGGVTPAGMDAFNELSELIMEASLRINMPAPYISLRLYRDAPERYWQAAANYISSGLGFPVVNDEVLIPAMLRHGRSLGDARDYICSCCYEHTIPGREAFHPSAIFVNLPLVLELALNQGRSLLSGDPVGCATPSVVHSIEELLSAFETQAHSLLEVIISATNRADSAHSSYRRYPLMSLFIDDCLSKAQDVCAGGARYNLTGCVFGGLPNVVNSLAAIQSSVFENQRITWPQLQEALRSNFAGSERLRQQLLAAPKWGNDDPRVDAFAAQINRQLYAELSPHTNARGGRWQLALYSFVANHWMGEKLGASADGRLARDILTRNLNPTWGTDHKGPTAVLRSLSQIDFTTAPDGSSLDLRFDPAMIQTPELRQTFIGFLKAFVELGIMEMQISVVDTETLLDARAHPEKHLNLLVRVAGYSARFVDLSPQEQDEIIGRSQQSWQ